MQEMAMDFMRKIILACLTLAIASICWYSCLIRDVDTSSTLQKSRFIAYYQTSNRHHIALRVVIALFHRVYPWVELYLYLDSDTTDNIVSRLNKQVRIKFITDKQARGASRSPLHFDTVHAAEAYIQRLQATAGLMPRGWVFLLEDDVWAIQAVEEKDLRYDISGTCWAIYKREYGAIIKNETSLCYGGYGGHFINSSRLLGLSASRYRPLIADLLAAFSPIASDELLSAVILQDGGTIGYYTGFYEHLVGDGPMRTQHQMKWFYSWWTS